MAPLKDCLVYWKKKLEQGVDEEKALQTIRKLYKAQITVELLRETQIGKIVKKLGKQPGKVGSYASIVLKKWRDMVSGSKEYEPSCTVSEKSPKQSAEGKQNSVDNGLHQISYEPTKISKLNGHAESSMLNEDYTRVSVKQEFSDDYDGYSYANSTHNGKVYSNSVKESSNYLSKYGNHADISNKYLNGANNMECGYDPEYPEINPSKRIRMDVKDNYGKSFEQEISYSSHSNSKMKANDNCDLETKKSHKTEAAKKPDFEVHSSKSSSSSHGRGTPTKEKHSNHEHNSKDHQLHKKRPHDSVEHKSKESVQNGHVKHPISKKHPKLDSEKIDRHHKNTHEKSHHSGDKKSSKSTTKSKTISTNHQSEKHQSGKSKQSLEMEGVKSTLKIKSPAKVKVPQAEELTASEASFEACLGLNDVVVTKKKKASPSKPGNLSSPCEEDHVKKKKHKQKKDSKSLDKKKSLKSSKSDSSHKSSGSGSKPSTSSSSSSKSSKLSPESVDDGTSKKFNMPKPVPLEKVDILSTLPEIQPNYKPLPRLEYDLQPKKKTMTNEEAIIFTSSKKDRTAVYSGRRNFYSTEVPSLIEMCTRILIENIDYIEFTGGVPFELLKPVLERCTPCQLYKLEDYNSYLLEDTHDLWERHCKKEFRNSKREESETWREMYLRCYEEKERKLKALTANISASMSKSNPVRQVKLAYVDSVVKPPREVARKQARNGTALPVSHTVKAGPPSKATPRPTAPAINAAASKHSAPVSFKKPKMAPLMAKTLKAMKRGYRR